MKITIYIDVLIILNTLVNYFILLAVKKISRDTSSRWRIALGSLFGGVSSLLIFMENSGIVMTLLKMLTAAVMVLVSFKFSSMKRFLKNMLWLFFISFVFGGLIFAVYMCFGFDTLIYTNGIVYFDISMTFLIVCSVLSYLLITAVSLILDKKAPKTKEYHVTLSKNGKTVSCTALMDTGNNLREPFSGYPVIFIDETMFKSFFSDDSVEKMLEVDKTRLIPITTVQGESIAAAFRPEFIKIGDYETDKIYVAQGKTDENYKIILNINLEGEIHNE